jgi:hypothetical protein
MFGLLKENIINNLEKTYIDKGEKQFKKDFNTFMKVIKESKDLKKIYNIYSLYENIHFDNETIAREFVEESIQQLKTLDKNSLISLKTLTESVDELPKNSRYYYLDQLAFNEKVSIKNKVEYKINLINSLVKENKNNENLINLISNADKTINENLNKLTEEQVEVVNMLIENDSQKITNYYTNLVNETQDLIDNKIIESKDSNDTVIKLIETKRKLKSLSKEANVNNIELILDLKSIL